jgi:hypothetical protein
MDKEWRPSRANLPMSVAPRVIVRLAVAVGAQELEVFDSIVESVAVDVMER